jgi:hypothetical protein
LLARGLLSDKEKCRFFHTFVPKSHVTCPLVADAGISPNGARHTKPRASDPQDRAALGGHEKEFGALTGRDISLNDAAFTAVFPDKFPTDFSSISYSKTM